MRPAPRSPLTGGLHRARNQMRKALMAVHGLRYHNQNKTESTLKWTPSLLST